MPMTAKQCYHAVGVMPFWNELDGMHAEFDGVMQCSNIFDLLGEFSWWSNATICGGVLQLELEYRDPPRGQSKHVFCKHVECDGVWPASLLLKALDEWVYMYRCIISCYGTATHLIEVREILVAWLDKEE